MSNFIPHFTPLTNKSNEKSPPHHVIRNFFVVIWPLIYVPEYVCLDSVNTYPQGLPRYVVLTPFPYVLMRHFL